MKLKKRFIALITLLLLMVAGLLVYILATGNSCTVKMNNTQIDGLTMDMVSYEISDPSVAEVTDLQIVTPDTVIGSEDTKTVSLTFRGRNSGSTKVIVYHRFYDELAKKYDRMPMTPNLYLRVMPWGTVIETNYLTFSGWRMAEYLILLSMALVATVCLVSFIESFVKAKFSYSMVAYGGTAAYSAFMLLLSLYDMRYFNSFRSFLYNISDTGYWFAILTSPVMILLSIIIAFSNIWLLWHEGFRPQNMLGIGLGVFWAAALAVVMNLIPNLFHTDVSSSNIYTHLTYSLAYVLSFFECMLLSTIVCAFLASKYKPPHNKDYLIILGCGIRRDGSLTPILRGRVDAAIRFEKAQFAETGKHATFVPSGGQGADEVISESEAMKRYLLEQEYPEEQIIKEDQSVNTYQNIQFSRDRIAEDAGSLDNIKAGFATTNYHIFRGYILSQKHGLDAQGISAKTKWYFFPNAFLREFAGLLMDKKISISIIVAVLLIGYTLGVHLLNEGRFFV